MIRTVETRIIDGKPTPCAVLHLTPAHTLALLDPESRRIVEKMANCTFHFQELHEART